jgi:phosphoesterase RecJ-like protein
MQLKIDKKLEKIPFYIETEIYELISGQPKNIVITTHINPDGDAIGSILALYFFLKDIGHKVNMICPNNFPDFLSWMPESEKIIIFSHNHHKCIDLINSADIIFNCDYNDINRLESFSKYLKNAKAKHVVIDHHPDFYEYTKYKVYKTDVSAAAELVYEFITNCPFYNNITNEMATCIYVGMMTDSVEFSKNMKKRSFEILAHLSSLQINIEQIHNNVYDNYSFDRMRFLGLALYKKMKIIPECNTAYIYLSIDEQKKYNYQIGDTEGFVNFPLSIKGIKISVLFIEKKDHIKISFRSKGNFSVNEFARKYYNGGGHKNAAGGKSFTSLKNTLIQFNKLIKQNIDNLK